MKYLLIPFFLITIGVQAQVSPQNGDKANAQTIKLDLDTVWNYRLADADVILKVKITDRVYMTFSGIFNYEVIQVIKGNFQAKKGDFYLGLIETSQQRYELRFRPIQDHDIVFIGLVKPETYMGDPVKDDVSGEEWEFLMSSETFP